MLKKISIKFNTVFLYKKNKKKIKKILSSIYEQKWSIDTSYILKSGTNESRVHLIWYQSYALNLVVLVDW